MNGALELKGDNQKVVWAEFSALSWVDFVMSEISWHLKVRLCLAF
jgi:hypothetical protein